MAGRSSSSPELAGEAPTLSPAASSRALPGSASSSSSNRVASCAAPPTLTLRPSISVGRRLELPVEVVEPDDRQRGVAAAAPEDVAPHDALAVLRHRDVEQEGGRRREVDAAHPARAAAGDGAAAGQEGRAHVRVRGEVLHVGHVAVLPEERRARDQRPGRRRVELVGRRGEDHEVAGAGRVRHVGRAAGAVRDVARLGLGVGAVDHVPALGLAVARPVVLVLEREERGLDLPRRSRPRRPPRPAGARGSPGRARRG